MERISIQIDSPGYVKVSDIAEELISFASIIERKYNIIDFEFGFCFRALYTTRGINSKVRYFKDINWLSMDIIMPLDEFNPYKHNISMQRLIMGKYFFPFFADKIKKYKNKLPSLKLVVEDLIEDMRLFLIDNLWLPDENGNLKLSIIENVSFERAMSLFGNPKHKDFKSDEKGILIQTLTWIVEENTEIHAIYKLIDKKWLLQKYEIVR